MEVAVACRLAVWIGRTAAWVYGAGAGFADSLAKTCGVEVRPDIVKGWLYGFHVPEEGAAMPTLTRAKTLVMRLNFMLTFEIVLVMWFL